MSESTQTATNQLPSKTRWRMQWQGLAEICGAAAWVFAASYLAKVIDPNRLHVNALWFRGLNICLCLIGTALVTTGLWHLNKSRANRNDAIGIISLLLILGSLPVLLAWTFYTAVAMGLGSLLGG